MGISNIEIFLDELRSERDIWQLTRLPIVLHLERSKGHTRPQWHCPGILIPCHRKHQDPSSPYRARIHPTITAHSSGEWPRLTNRTHWLVSVLLSPENVLLWSSCLQRELPTGKRMRNQKSEEGIGIIKHGDLRGIQRIFGL
ncbi:hypothetical protein QAD02_017664 [Eretmocerus hayati]|uniref:Uncharacterized protein n=1 Tax=Eretmocerus hayati TaxID=131215 RepID=A0ACC2PEH7_9HYME|nr:hypothetical protein QAD02_017664 [Eretmocerus hayati]